MNLSEISIHAWMQEYEIKNEKGEPIDFYDHPYLYDIYRDRADNIVVTKAAQVGLSTCEVLKNLYDAKHQNLDIIYTLPTDDEVKTFVGGSVNRIIEQNPILLEYTKDKDSIEQKSVGGSRIYFRGTWGQRKAQMVPADRLVHDEIDTSKPDVIAAYQARLQHSKYKQTHVFSHPSYTDVTTDIFWQDSDQKHWFVKCPHCSKRQYLSWDLNNVKKMSIDLVKREFICKKCNGVLDNNVRRNGEWVKKYLNKQRSGYWVSLLSAPYISADYIIKKHENPQITPFEFQTKVIGLPHNDGNAKLLLNHFTQNLTGQRMAPGQNERVIIGIDTGLRLDYVLGTTRGLFHHGECDDYGELNEFMIRWPKAIAVIDAGGDLIGSRAFAERWQGRVFLCYLTGDKTKKEMVSWQKGDNYGSVTADRNRLIQLTVDEFRTKRLPVYGTDDDWYEYYLDWRNMTRIEVYDKETNVLKGRKWVRAGRDHKALATVFWRVGISRFAMNGNIFEANNEKKPNSYMVNPDNTVDFNPEEMFNEDDEDDWRI